MEVSAPTCIYILNPTCTNHSPLQLAKRGELGVISTKVCHQEWAKVGNLKMTSCGTRCCQIAFNSQESDAKYFKIAVVDTMTTKQQLTTPSNKKTVSPLTSNFVVLLLHETKRTGCSAGASN